MKKKIINGILMSALLLAGTTSFVSCKDNVDDTETGIRIDMNSLQQKISDLETKINNIPTPDIPDLTTIKDDIKKLKEEVAKIDGKADKSDLEALENRVKDLEEAIKNLGGTAISGAIVQETLDRIIGTINLPGFNPGFLNAYVGENLSGMPEFPIAGDDYNVDPNGNVLKNSEIACDPVWNSGKKSYLVNGNGNAGKLYFTINPRKVDPALCTFDLINSTGEESPVKLSNVVASDHVITWALGKHGNGIVGTRDGEDAVEYGDADAINADIAAQKTYLYEADATVSLEGIEKIHFDYTKFGYQNLWDAGSEIVYGTQVSEAAKAQNVFGRFTYLINQVKAKNINGVLEGSLKIVQDLYNGVFSQKNKLQKQALRVSWSDGENDVISPFDITTVTINPLSWKQMWLFDQMNPQWNLNGLTPIVQKIVSAVKKQLNLPANAAITINLGPIDLSTITSTIAVNVPGQTVTASDGVTTVTVPAQTVNVDLSSMIAQLQTAVNSGLDTSSLEAQINNLLKPYTAISKATGSGVMARVTNYLNKATDKIITELDGMPCWRLTEPTILFESQYGINRLEPMMTVHGDKMTFILTSMTEEYIVPVYMKYVALLYGGKVKQYYLLNGYEKICQFDIPDQECEIVYQAADFYGNVVTKRYPLNR